MPQSTDSPLSGRPSAPFTLTVQLNAEDYRHYYALVGRRQSNRATAVMFVAAVFAAILVALLFRALASWETTNPATIELVGRYSLFAYGIGVLVFLSIGTVMRRRSITGTLASSPHAFDPKTIVIGDDAVTITGKLSEVRYTWPSFTQLTVGKELLCLWIGTQSAGIIPQRAFATNEALRAAIAFIEDKIAVAKQTS